MSTATHDPAALPCQYAGNYLGAAHAKSERKTWAVIWLCGAMMVAEIAGGLLFGSIALVADGLHMSTHAGALLLAALAYTYARKHAHDPRFTFGTGKLGDLAGFTSAIILAMIALLIGYEAVSRFIAPVPIHFTEAIPIACLGLAVNVASAWLLSGGAHQHGHGHSHGHGRGHEHGRGHSHGDAAGYEHDGSRQPAHAPDGPHAPDSPGVPDGPDVPVGPQGHDGPQGPDGPHVPDGLDVPDGPNVPDGPQGHDDRRDHDAPRSLATDRAHDHATAHRLATPAGTFTLEVFEDGVPPRFRLRADTALPAASTTIETERPGGTRQRFAMTDRGGYLESIEPIPEPHAFVAHVRIADAAYAVTFEEPEHAHGRAARDNNIRAAITHVIADAAVSVLVIAGLLLARTFGWLWMDPLAGIVGACVIASWSYGLIRDTGAILLDMNPDRRMAAALRQAIEADGDTLTDLHLWRLGPGHLGAIVAIRTRRPRGPAFYHARLARFRSVSHLTVEVQAP